MVKKAFQKHMVKYNFSGKTVLITGGSSGIGLATAEKFLESGAEVIILSRNPERNLITRSEKVFFIPMDLNDPRSVEQAFDILEEKHTVVDIAVNSAAADSGVGKPLHLFSEEEFDSTVNVNLKGLWLCMKKQIQWMLATPERKTSIINLSSVNGLGGIENGSIYAATKAAVLGLTKSAALELADSNISVNAVVPGAFDTPLLEKAMLAQSGGDKSKLTSVRDKYEAVIPKQRLGDPSEVASLILWLASGEAEYLIGHSIIIDGGMSSRFR